MFDSSTHIEIPAPFRLGDAVITVRYPTDEEWYRRARSKRIVNRRLGRGVTQPILPEPGEADLTLYQTITQNSSPPLTAAEASQVLDALGQATVTAVTIEKGTAVVDMETMTGPVHLRSKIPTADQVVQWRRSAYRIHDLNFGQQEIRLNPEAGAGLWDACEGSSSDYKTAIPGIHKDAAIRALIDFSETRLGPKQDDANF